jgi:hypothetical protein
MPERIIASLTNVHHQNMSSIAKQASVVQVLLYDEQDGYIYGNR